MSGLFLNEKVLLQHGFIGVQKLRKRRTSANEEYFRLREKRNSLNECVKTKIQYVQSLQERRDAMNSKVNEFKKLRDKAVRRRDETGLQTLIDYYDGLQDFFHGLVQDYAKESEYYPSEMNKVSREIDTFRDTANYVHKQGMNMRYTADEVHAEFVKAFESIKGDEEE